MFQVRFLRFLYPGVVNAVFVTAGFKTLAPRQLPASLLPLFIPRPPDNSAGGGACVFTVTQDLHSVDNDM